MKFTFSEKGRSKGVAVVRITEEKEDEIVRFPDGSREILLGVGKRSEMTLRKFFLLPRRAVMLAKGKRLPSIAIDIDEWRFEKLKLSNAELGEILSVNILMADFAFNEFKERPKEGFPSLGTVDIFGADSGVKAGIRKGIVIGEEVNRSRRIATMPGGDMTPSILASHAKASVRNLPVLVKIFGVREMEKLRMGGVLGVGKGSVEKPKFIAMEYSGGKKSEKPIVLVGKGVTFDTGGINLKPEDSMGDMHMDMSGGAAVIHALAIAARLKLKRNVIVLVPAVENMPSGESYRPGDIIRSMSGKTIEVANTDAEGRVILADALTYAKRYKPSLVVDVATLTGAAVVALGERASAIFTKDERLESKLRHIGEATGEYVWPLPLWDEYDDDIKGTFGDVSNLGKTRWGGAITAAAFLKQFVGGYPWVHIDIAPRMTPIEGEFLAKGSVGAPIRLLVRLIEEG